MIKRSLAVLLLSTSLLTPQPASAVRPAGDLVTIEKIKVKGSGCRDNTVAVALSPDKTAFTVLYSAYLAQAGAGARNKEQRRACNLTIRLNVPATMQYAVTAVDYRGFAHLEPGATAALSARYQFQDSGAPTSTVHSFASGLDDSWQVTDLAGSGAAFSGCGRGRKVDIDTELRVTTDRADAPTSFITMDSTDSAFASTYRLTYRTC
ncbi:DUF4360 domain-containing protein [Actinoplanes sp. NPDC051859]|uniref:DUF4360 domain-containing protein n=1 Tax=Actinoplanes sp. NPDC051859 TaxID=3363909 RepID=UPI00378EFAC9